MANSTRRLQLYLCYAPTDKVAVTELYQQLTDTGLEVWFDEESLLPGSDRQLAIAAAIKTADVILICLSQQALTTVGGLHREMKLALDKADEQPEGKITIIPVRLDDCEMPSRLSQLVPLDLFNPNSRQRLINQLQKLAQQRGLDTAPITANVTNQTIKTEPTPKTEVIMPNSQPDNKYNFELPEELSFDEKQGIVERLLKCRSITDPGSLQTVINSLPHQIGVTIVRSMQLNIGVTNLLNACLSQPNGIQELLKVLAFYEQNSVQYQNLLSYVKSISSPKIQNESQHNASKNSDPKSTPENALTEEPRLDNEQRQYLLKFLNERFSLTELETICFNLGGDYEDLRHDTKPNFALDLLTNLENQGKVTELVKEVIRERTATPVLGNILNHLTVKITITTEREEIKSKSNKQNRLLFFAPDPARAKLSISDEIQVIRELLEKPDYAARFAFTPAENIKSLDEIEDKLSQYQPNLVHFSCHANSSGHLIFYDNQGLRVLISANDVQTALSYLNEKVACVVLSACHSYSLVEALLSVCGCIVATSEEISNPNMVIFSKRFYGMLFSCSTIEKAFEAGKNRLPVENRSIVGLYPKDSTALQFRFC